MPVFFNDATDDPLAWDACTGFAGGQMSNSRPNLLEPNQLSLIINGDISRTGELVTRRGSARVGDFIGGGVGRIQGVAFYDTPTAQYLVACAGARLWKFDGGSWSYLGDGFWRAADSVRPVHFVQGVNLLYFTDGAGHLSSWDGTTVVDLGAGGVGGLTNKPPVGFDQLRFFTSRVIASAIATEPDAIYFSNFLDGATWARDTQQLQVGGGEGDPIMATVPWTKFDLAVLKRHSIYVVDCDPSDPPAGFPSGVANFSVTLLNRSVGCRAPDSAVQVQDDIFFLSDDGVRTVRRSVATEDRAELGESLSYPIRDVIDRINAAAVEGATAVYWNHRYMLAVPLDGSTVNNAVLIYNTLTNTWSGYWMGWTPTCWAVSAYSGALRLNFGQSIGSVHQWLDWVPVSGETDTTFTDAGVGIQTTLKMRAFQFSEPISPKTGFNCELEFNGSTAVVDAKAVLDDGAPQEVATFLTLSASLFLPLTLPFSLPKAGIVRHSFDLQRFGQFRELQFLLFSGEGKLSLRSAVASAFVDTMEVQR